MSGASESAPAPHPFASLTPDVVLDAVQALGLAVDGRLMALSSYENRVYQLMLDSGEAVVAKFYRPSRWSDAQILEEHAFAQDLMDDEVPAVGPLRLHGHSLHRAQGFAFSVSPYRGGRRPELDDDEVLEWLGRFIARIHNVGARAAFVHRPTLTPHSFGVEARDWLLSHDQVAPAWRGAWRRTWRASWRWCGSTSGAWARASWRCTRDGCRRGWRPRCRPAAAPVRRSFSRCSPR